MNIYKNESEEMESNQDTDENTYSRCVTNVKNTVADKLHCLSEAMGKKTSSGDFYEELCRYSKQSCDWLDRSAERIRQFDYKQADSRIRNYIRLHPAGRLIIAGVVGIAGGILLRRR